MTTVVPSVTVDGAVRLVAVASEGTTPASVAVAIAARASVVRDGTTRVAVAVGRPARAAVAADGATQPQLSRRLT